MNAWAREKQKYLLPDPKNEPATVSYFRATFIFHLAIFRPLILIVNIKNLHPFATLWPADSNFEQKVVPLKLDFFSLPETSLLAPMGEPSIQLWKGERGREEASSVWILELLFKQIKASKLNKVSRNSERVLFHILGNTVAFPNYFSSNFR